KGSCPIRPPKAFAHWIANLSESKNPLAPLTLGALTFFLPCGFTQSLQLVALASGSMMQGALTMGIFSLGTLPALLGISLISSTVEGTISRLFLRFAGTLVFILALWNLNSGLLLTGVDAASLLPSREVAEAGNDPNVTLTSDGQQIINMKVTPYGYEPRSFIIAAGKPTWVYADAASNIGGCTSVLTAPSLGLSKFLKPGERNQLGPFTPTRDFTLTCSMGMVRASVRVAGGAGGTAPLAAQVAPPGGGTIPANAQVVDLWWTIGGYTPKVLEVAQGRPTVVRVSATAQPGGCMSTLVFPNFDQSAFVPQPGQPPAQITLATDRAQAGDYPITCGMGAKMATLRVL
ncbi:sulfite exporter TauE/SafE family protein, partial [Candidatus Peregrinibacteria bacterium]|nr:sulfite exporter TauE/SafE family protein [Candidatus Peregrinibacteria bacterium]